ncbi:uncharacterized protein [Drosophila bipectinata]|uniref:uncharacterized protein n=1 Tax=Drosophila bipectinata TaxID=42026 RepID=UPI001C8AEF7B|nr:uncharacterized protein LOC108123289 [Drosophila bipectinata]
MDHLKPGDSCLECLELGLDHKLRLFYINLDEELLKCESRTCLWPHNDEVSSDEDFDFGDPSETDLSLSDGPSANPPAHPAAKTSDKVECSYSADASLPATAGNDDDDQFILELLKQLDPAPQMVPMEPSLPDLSSSAHTEAKIQPDFDMPNLMDFNIDFPVSVPATETKSVTESPIEYKETDQPPMKLKLPEKKGALLKNLKSQLADKLNSSSEKEEKIEQKVNPIPADIKPQIQNNLQIDPFSSPLKKASTQPRSPPPALNVIISIPELKKPNSFLDAIKRHDKERSSAARRRYRVPGPAGRGRYTKAVMQLFDNLETTKAKQRPPQP